MKKLFALMTAALLMLTVTSCQSAEDTEPEETEEWRPIERIPNRPGEYFTDLARTFSIGDRSFTLDMTFDEARELKPPILTESSVSLSFMTEGT